MWAALIILISLLIVSAIICIVVILIGSFDETEIKILVTCGALSAYTALMTPSLFHIGRRRYIYLTKTAITTTSFALVMVLFLVWAEGPIKGDLYFRILATLGVLAVSTNHSLVLLMTRSTKLIVKLLQRTTVSIIVSLTIFVLAAIWNGGLPEQFLRVVFVLVVLDALGSIATPILFKSIR